MGPLGDETAVKLSRTILYQAEQEVSLGLAEYLN